MNNIIIFGDSYSTFQNSIPDGYPSYYPNLDVQNIEETWWKLLIANSNVHLIQNNSWSGSTIGYTGYENSDCSSSSSFIYRYRELKKEGYFEKNAIDTIFIFGGTNDSWSEAPLGEMKFFDWNEQDLFNVLPAICYFAYLLKTDLPNVKIVFIINTEIKEEIQNGIEKAAQYFGVDSIRLTDINKKDGHPTAKGMVEISEQILKALKDGKTL